MSATDYVIATCIAFAAAMVSGVLVFTLFVFAVAGDWDLSGTGKWLAFAFAFSLLFLAVPTLIYSIALPAVIQETRLRHPHSGKEYWTSSLLVVAGFVVLVVTVGGPRITLNEVQGLSLFVFPAIIANLSATLLVARYIDGRSGTRKTEEGTTTARCVRGKPRRIG